MYRWLSHKNGRAAGIISVHRRGPQQRPSKGWSKGRSKKCGLLTFVDMVLNRWCTYVLQQKNGCHRPFQMSFAHYSCARSRTYLVKNTCWWPDAHPNDRQRAIYTEGIFVGESWPAGPISYPCGQQDLIDPVDIWNQVKVKSKLQNYIAILIHHKQDSLPMHWGDLLSEWDGRG